MLLDEATAAIDPTKERHLQAALVALVRDTTLVVVAHRLSTIRSADQIVVLDAGRVAEQGTTTICWPPAASPPACGASASTPPPGA